MERLPVRDPERAADLIRRYFVDGSVEKALLNIPPEKYISEATYRRVLDEWKIVRSAGRPHSLFSEATFFFTRMVQEQQQIQIMYRRMPPSFKTSVATLQRIFQRVVSGIAGRSATALFITSDGDPERVLIGRDVSTPRPEIGKSYGYLTVPATFSPRGENSRISILRVLQQEVLTGPTIQRNLPLEIIPQEPKPFGSVYVLDVKVSLYHLVLSPELLTKVESPKIRDFQLSPASQIASCDSRGGLRAGMIESFEAYRNFLQGRVTDKIIPQFCSLNNQLINLTKMVPNYLWASRFGR